MPKSLEVSSPLSPMDIARVARLLWQQAGAQPGRYAEYWSKVEQALSEARQQHALRALVETPLCAPPGVQSPETKGTAQSIETTVWGDTAWEPEVRRHEVGGAEGTDAPRCQTPRQDP